MEIIPSDESILTNTSKRQSMVSQSSMNSLEAFDKMYKDVVVSTITKILSQKNDYINFRFQTVTSSINP